MRHFWNRMPCDDRYRFLRRWLPDCIAVNHWSLKKWNHLPPALRYAACFVHAHRKEVA